MKSPARKFRIAKTGTQRPEVSDAGGFTKVLQHKSVAVYLTRSKPLTAGETIVHRGQRVAQTSVPRIELPELIRSQVESFLNRVGCAVVSREQFAQAGISVPEALLDEQKLSVSPLTNEQIRRVGRLRVADYLVEATVVSAHYQHLYFEPVTYPIRMSQFAVRIKIYDTTTAEVLWQGSNFLRASDLLEKSLSLNERDLESGQQWVEARLPSFDVVIRKCIDDLLRKIP